MSFAKPAGLLSAFSRTDGPRRDTLRHELAKARLAKKDEGERPKLVLASA